MEASRYGDGLGTLSEWLERVACGLFTAAATAAPWLLGARSRVDGIALWFAGALTIASMLVFGSIAARRQLSQFASWTLAPVILLIGCVAWWVPQTELDFATKFARDQWTALEQMMPGLFLQLARSERMAYFAALLLAFVATQCLGRVPGFRRHLTVAIGISAMSVAVYSLGERWYLWPEPPWAIISGEVERFNGAFFHYSAMAACLNVGWPLLVFPISARRGGGGVRRAGRILASAAIVALTAAAMPLGKADAALAVGACLLVAGVFWMAFARLRLVNRTSVRVLIAITFFAIVGGQIASIVAYNRSSPDHWPGGRLALQEAPEREATLQNLAMMRGDRLIPSAVPARPATWVAALRMAADHPWFGDGPGSWSRRIALYSNDGVVNSAPFQLQFAHQDLLQTAAEWGGVPALAWCFLWIYAVYRATGRSPGGGVSEQGLILALVGIALHSMVHFSLQVPALQLWTILLLGLAASPEPGDDPEGRLLAVPLAEGDK